MAQYLARMSATELERDGNTEELTWDKMVKEKDAQRPTFDPGQFNTMKSLLDFARRSWKDYHAHSTVELALAKEASESWRQ